MKKLLVVVLFFAIAGAVFSDVSGSVTNTVAYDADAKTIAETIDTSVSIGPLVFANKLALTQLLAEAQWDYTGSINWTVTDLLSVSITLTRGIDTVDKMPLTLTASYKITDSLSAKLTYVNDNINVDGEDGTGELETGTITAEAKLSF